MDPDRKYYTATVQSDGAIQFSIKNYIEKSGFKIRQTKTLNICPSSHSVRAKLVTFRCDDFFLLCLIKIPG